MRNKGITFSGKTVYLDEVQIDTDYPVSDAFRTDDKIIVLYDPDAYTEKFGQFPNLVAFNLKGEKVWTAELPTTTSGERYWRIVSKEPLMADSKGSFSCTIDVSNGRIVKKEFYK